MKKKEIIYIVIMGIIAIILITIVALNNNSYNNKQDSKKQEETQQEKGYLTKEEKIDFLLNHLKEKYGEEFISTSFSGASILDKYWNMTAYPKTRNEEDSFKVSYNPETKEILDDYYGVLIKDEVETILNNIAKKHFKDYKIFIMKMNTYYDNNLTKGMTFEQAVTSGYQMNYSITLFLKEKQDVTKFREEIKQKGFTDSTGYYVLENANDYNNITEDNYQETISFIQVDKIKVKDKGYYND